MYNIALIATGHKDKGVCNSNELYKILEDATPDIIFEELSSHFFTAIYEGKNPDSLETKAIKFYLQKHPIVHYPVDLDFRHLVDKGFKNELKEMYDIFNLNPDYSEICIQFEMLSMQHGFSYLNSTQSVALLEYKHAIEKKILRKLNEKKLFTTYEKWLMIHDMRDREMVKNIYSYSNLNTYKNALFVVGAEHRRTIMNIVSVVEKNSSRKLNWNFDHFNHFPRV
jgi:hypothetical protein